MTDPRDGGLETALDEFEKAIRGNVERNLAILDRLEALRRGIRGGASLSQVLNDAERPLAVEMITSNLESLTVAGSTFRKAQAHALREEGMTIEAIAGLFGVTRQRISALLRQPTPHRT